MPPTMNLSIRVSVNICSTNINNLHPLKVRADTSLSVGEWSDPVIVVVLTS